MAGSTLDLAGLIARDNLAVRIDETYQRYETHRQRWQAEKQELRNYLFATDTSTTTNKSLPWKNSTTIPKLTQIRDNLHANYMSALFPNQNWFRWEGAEPEAEEESKRVVIEKYMLNKIVHGRFKQEVSKLVYDFIDYGNCFATTEWVEERLLDEETGEEKLGFIGPRAVRISPFDIIFNPAVSNFNKSPVIIRSVMTLGELKRILLHNPGSEEAKKQFEEAVNRAMNNRRATSSISKGEKVKQDAYMIDGFGSLVEYYQSGYVEILDFYGDLYDIDNDELLENHHIRVIDRSIIVSKEPNPKWTLGSQFHHSGWRTRPDNLYAMGPLDNLVGMQYRLDHLENLKADVFDLIAFPVLKIRGTVEDFVWRPNERIFLGDDGDVQMLVPDTTALNAEVQMQSLMNIMEEMAGAPRQAMGIRTPGEKTAFEVQTLDNAAGRIFQEKITQFEEEVLEPLLNDMLELARRKLDGSDLIRVLVDEIDVVLFEEITRDDLKASGRLRPTGAAHFSRRNNMLQNLVQLSNTALLQNPSVGVHFSGFKTAKLIEDLLNIDRFGLVEKNVQVSEQMDTQRLVQAAQENIEVEQTIPAGVTADEALGGL